MDYKILTLKKDESEKKLRELGKLIFDGTKPPPGPYGFFIIMHIRLKDFKIVTE